MQGTRSGRPSHGWRRPRESKPHLVTMSADHLQPPHRGHSMTNGNRIGKLTRGTLTLVALVLVAALGCGCKPKANAYAPPPIPDVTVAHPIHKPVTRYLEYTGTTEPYEAVELRARVAGFLDKGNFKPGASVKKDDLLFVIDPRVYEAQAHQAEADLAARRSVLRLAELTLKRVSEAGQAAAGAGVGGGRAPGGR